VFAAPNPFRTRLAIQLAVAHAQRVRLRVYDLSGRVVATLGDGRESPGSRVVVWDGRDHRGRAAPAGVYILELEASEVQQSRRIQLVR
jgi:flagellar hook assembly protein FlgD